MLLSIHLLFQQSSNNAGFTMMADVLYFSAPREVSVLFVRNPTTTVRPQTILSWQDSYQVIAPLFFKIVYLSWERSYINILLIFACTVPWCLISYQALLPMGYHNAQEVAVCQASSSLDSRFEENQRTRKYFWIKVVSVWGGMLFLLKRQTFAPLEELKDLGDLQPNKDSKWPPVLW